MSAPLTRSGRPNTSGTRGGFAGRRPVVLAPDDTYNADNEQQHRKQLMDELANLRLLTEASSFTFIAARAPRLDFSLAQNAQLAFLLPRIF